MRLLRLLRRLFCWQLDRPTPMEVAMDILARGVGYMEDGAEAGARFKPSSVNLLWTASGILCSFRIPHRR